MKNNKIVKIAFLVLSLTLVLGAVFAMGAGAAEPETKTPEIISQNIEYGERFRLMFAVDASTVAEGPVTLTIYSTKPSGETANTVEAITVASATAKEQLGSLGVDAYVFTATKGIPYTEMTKEYYIQAVDNKGNKSEIMRYSVAEYLYQRLATTGDKAPTPAQENLYNNAIAFGKNAQIVVNKVSANSDELISNLRYVTIDGGTIDGFTAGVYPIGKVITPKVVNAIAAKWTVTAYNDGTATPAGGQTSFVVTDADKIEVSCTAADLVSYRANAVNLDSLTTYNDAEYFNTYYYRADNQGYISSGGTATGVFVKDEEKGTVAKITFNETNGSITHTKLDTSIATLDTAEAVEFSFDIKLDTTQYDVDSTTLNPKSKYVNPYMGSPKADGTISPTHRVGLYTYLKNVSSSPLDKLLVGNIGAITTDSTTNRTFCDGVDPADWYHVRMVYYKGDTNCYVYINGSVEPTYIHTTLNNSAFTGDLSQIKQANIRSESLASKGAIIYLDNVFFGYTLDKGPNAVD